MPRVHVNLSAAVRKNSLVSDGDTFDVIRFCSGRSVDIQAQVIGGGKTDIIVQHSVRTDSNELLSEGSDCRFFGHKTLPCDSEI